MSYVEREDYLDEVNWTTDYIERAGNMSDIMTKMENALSTIKHAGAAIIVVAVLSMICFFVFGSDQIIFVGAMLTIVLLLVLGFNTFVYHKGMKWFELWSGNNVSDMMLKAFANQAGCTFAAKILKKLEEKHFRRR